MMKITPGKLSKPGILWGLSAVILLCAGLWYSHTMHGCRNVSCLLVSGSQFSKKFDARVPLFMEWNSSKPLLDAMPDSKDNPKIKHMLDVLTQNTQRLRQMAPALPTCAVVGNSQNLLGSNYGGQIDGHNYVFRMNSAPTYPYEPDVGNRTTHHIFSHYYSPNIVNGEIRIRTYSPDTFNIVIPLHSDLTVPFSVTYQKKDYSAFGNYFMNLAEALSYEGKDMPPLTRDNMTQVRDLSNLLTFSPDFLWYANAVWFTPADKKKTDIASTGFMTIILALHLCDQVDLFGFGANRDGEWGQYFSERKDKPARHHPGYQEDFLNSLQDNHIVRVFKGK